MTIFETTKLAPAKQRAERSLIWLGAVTTGVVVTNPFAPQILVGLIGRSLAMTAWQAGLVSTLTLLGYALGLLLLVPLVDLIENRRLILRTLAAPFSLPLRRRSRRRRRFCCWPPSSSAPPARPSR